MPGLVAVNSTQTLRDLVAAASLGEAISLYLHAGWRYALGGTELQVQGFNLTLFSAGEGAILDAQQQSRHFSVSAGGHLVLLGLHMLGGEATVRTREGVCGIRHTDPRRAASRPRAAPCSQYGGLAYLTSSSSASFSGCNISSCSATCPASATYAVRSCPAPRR